MNAETLSLLTVACCLLPVACCLLPVACSLSRSAITDDGGCADRTQVAQLTCGVVPAFEPSPEWTTQEIQITIQQ